MMNNGTVDTRTSRSLHTRTQAHTHTYTHAQDKNDTAKYSLALKNLKVH